MKNKTCRILSIDACADMESGPWGWNNLFHVGDYPIDKIEHDAPGDIIQYMREKGYLSEYSKDDVYIDDDDDEYNNILILARSNHMPLFMIAYGKEMK
jgi:hypothetical protein